MTQEEVGRRGKEIGRTIDKVQERIDAIRNEIDVLKRDMAAEPEAPAGRAESDGFSAYETLSRLRQRDALLRREIAEIKAMWSSQCAGRIAGALSDVINLMSHERDELREALCRAARIRVAEIDLEAANLCAADPFVNHAATRTQCARLDVARRELLLEIAKTEAGVGQTKEEERP